MSGDTMIGLNPRIPRNTGLIARAWILLVGFEVEYLITFSLGRTVAKKESIRVAVQAVHALLHA
jgi:hypothetical protein